VQLVFLYSALPQMGIRLSVVEAALIGLMLSESPYVAEIVRRRAKSLLPSDLARRAIRFCALHDSYRGSVRVSVSFHTGRFLSALGMAVNPWYTRISAGRSGVIRTLDPHVRNLPIGVQIRPHPLAFQGFLGV
jgi:hypothetical protein